jgi:hypothetical protein
VEKDGVTVHPAYAQYSSYEDKLDKRPVAVKRDWWVGILVQLEANGGVVTVTMIERLARYTQSARSTEARKKYGDRRRAGGIKKASDATAVLGAEEGFSQVVDDCAEVEGDFELQVLEEVTEVAASKKAHATKARPLAVERAGVEDVLLLKVEGRLRRRRRKGASRLRCLRSVPLWEQSALRPARSRAAR